ncbi:LysR family transcriptional regulator [Pectinatus sottacetonis]|uniref:LysR family transcriptional regulator n=1 Tax=Pectinatus sottacetonis TaxID=1002795 RepID=UPI0018C57BF9|nr:LysR family transcriptional regulator [Pectinatus sottacetonis]
MESNDLRIFKEVAVEGTVTRAAEKMGYVQSNITARIRVLERELGIKLFFRKHKMILSPAGEKLLPYAQQVTKLLDEAKYVFDRENELCGRLAIGGYNSVSVLDLPRLFAVIHKKYPQIDLSFFMEPSAVLIDKILNFKLDGAFIVEYAFNSNILIKEWSRKQELVIIAPEHVKCQEEIYKMPFLMYTTLCYKRVLLEKFLNFKGIFNVRYMEFNDPNAIIDGVEAGLGVSFLEKQMVINREKQGKLKIFTVPKQFSEINTCFVRAKNIPLSPIVKQFINVLKHYG